MSTNNMPPNNRDKNKLLKWFKDNYLLKYQSIPEWKIKYI